MRPLGERKQPVIGRFGADLDIGMSGAFAVLAIVVLVAPPIGLYMVTMPAISAI